MKRDDGATVQTDKSDPNKVALSNGSYILWDNKDGYFRVAFYERRSVKSTDLHSAIALAMKKPNHNSTVREIVKYLEENHAAVST